MEPSPTEEKEQLEVPVAGPETPPATNMDSDDDVQSFASSGAMDDFEDQDSDVSVDG